VPAFHVYKGAKAQKPKGCNVVEVVRAKERKGARVKIEVSLRAKITQVEMNKVNEDHARRGREAPGVSRSKNPDG